MIITPARLEGAFLLQPEPVSDERGFFARTWCQREAVDAGISFENAQSSVSFNARKGTLRGMHYQKPPHAEAKLVRVTSGAIFDVIVDLRSGSSTHLEWQSFELSAANRHTLFIPEGFAHGFLTLEDETEIFYEISEYYAPNAGAGLRYDDPRLGIDWPGSVTVISEKDLEYPLIEDDGGHQVRAG